MKNLCEKRRTNQYGFLLQTRSDFEFPKSGNETKSLKGNVSLFEAGILCFNHRKSKVDDTNRRVTFSTSEISIKSLGRSAYRGHLT